MRAISLIGFKKSGKTSLAVKLADELKRRGATVSAAKCAHHGRADREGTDTSLLLEHADSVAFLGVEETSVSWPRRRHLPDLLPLLRADVLVVEGGKSLDWLPRILLLRDSADAAQIAELGPELALATYGPVQAEGIPAVDSIDELARLVLDRGFVLPGLDCGACGKASCRELAVDIVAGRASAADCRSLASPLTVSVNGQPLGMNPFVEKIISGSIRAMLAELKGYAPGRIDITLEG